MRESDPWTIVVGVATLAAALAGKRWLPRIPYLLTGIVAGALAALALAQLGIAEVATLGPLPSALPSLSMPALSPAVWRELAPIALALTVIGLTEAISSARAVALKSGQRIDGNREFIGQGLANIVGAFSSSYPTSGSFNRTGANFAAGARTPLASVFSALALIVILLFVRPLAAYLPVAAMAAVLFIVAWGLIDLAALRRILHTSRGEALTLVVTFLATLTIRLEVAILVGVLVSLLRLSPSDDASAADARTARCGRPGSALRRRRHRRAAVPAARDPAGRRLAVLRRRRAYPRRARRRARRASRHPSHAADR